MVETSEIPEIVYKAFKEEEFALNFINEGIFRIGSLNGYRMTEDASRKDPTEGESFYQFEEDLQQVHYSGDSETVRTSNKKGLMNVSGNWGNPTFIFCTSLPSVDVPYLKEKFGEFVVQINAPGQFISDMQEAILKTDYPFIGKGFVRGRYVEYSMGEVLTADLEVVDSCELATFQKLPEFSPENEYRFIAMMGAIKPPEVVPEFVELNIGRSLQYVQMY